MPSRADPSARRVLEQILRTISVGILAWMLWVSLSDQTRGTEISTRSGALTADLPDLTTRTVSPARIAVAFDSAPTPIERDWLAALDASGGTVEWRGDVYATAVSATPIVSPRGGILAALAAPAKSAVIVSDAAGPIDTVQADDGGARLVIAGATGIITARVAGASAQTAQSDSVPVSYTHLTLPTTPYV